MTLNVLPSKGVKHVLFGKTSHITRAETGGQWHRPSSGHQDGSGLSSAPLVRTRALQQPRDASSEGHEIRGENIGKPGETHGIQWDFFGLRRNFQETSLWEVWFKSHSFSRCTNQSMRLVVEPFIDQLSGKLHWSVPKKKRQQLVWCFWARKNLWPISLPFRSHIAPISAMTQQTTLCHIGGTLLTWPILVTLW